MRDLQKKSMTRVREFCPLWPAVAGAVLWDTLRAY